MNETTMYYDRTAEQYFQDTKDVNFSDIYETFLKYIPEGGRIMDVGCGSGRDVAAFTRRGYRAEGIDTSEKLIRLARENFGVSVTTRDMVNWHAVQPYDGIWCCSSLMHLREKEIQQFFQNLQRNLAPDGAFFLSVKNGIETGYDSDGRYMRNFAEDETRQWIEDAGLTICKYWLTEDKLNRNEFRWVNAIATGPSATTPDH